MSYVRYLLTVNAKATGNIKATYGSFTQLDVITVFSKSVIVSPNTQSKSL